MPSSQPTVDKISCDTESKPSVGCDEGTVDRLNEAPQYEISFGSIRCSGNHVIIDTMCREGIKLGYLPEIRVLRDGQPG